MRRNNVRILNFQRWEVAISFHVDYVYLFVLPILEKLHTTCRAHEPRSIRKYFITHFLYFKPITSVVIFIIVLYIEHVVRRIPCLPSEKRNLQSETNEKHDYSVIKETNVSSGN